MADLSKKQQLKLIDLVETFVDRSDIHDDLLADASVVHQFLMMSKNQSAVVFAFVNLLTSTQKSQLTMKDILTEEVMLELHIMHGFEQLDLVQWLRGIDFGGLRFFEMQAREKNILYLDQLMTRSQMNIVVIEGVRVDSVLGYFESLDRLVEYAIRKRISFKQFRQLLFTLAPTDDALIPVVDRLIKDHHVLKKITGSQQILPFRVFCALFDYLSNKQTYLTGIGQVFDQLLTSSTPVKTCQLLNQMPYPIIQYIVERFIQQNQLKIMDHLNDRLPLFDYGMIRKIVRRHSLGLNYKYD